MHVEAQFDLQLLQFVQLINALPIMLWDDFEQQLIKKNLMESCCDHIITQPNGNMSLLMKVKIPVQVLG